MDDKLLQETLELLGAYSEAKTEVQLASLKNWNARLRDQLRKLLETSPEQQDGQTH